MITINYDLYDNAFVMDTDGLGPRSLAIAAAGIVNGMVGEARALYGEDAAEAMLQIIRNLDDASVFSLDIGDGDADEKSQTETDVDRSGGAGTDGLCIRGEEQRGTGTAGDGQGGGAGAGESQA